MSGPPSGWSVLVTAEHGGHDVPAAYRQLFSGHEALLLSHRGWDPGTHRLAGMLATGLRAHMLRGTLTRLLVDLNRSAYNPRVFSEITRALPRAERKRLLERFHRPHWDRARAAVSQGIAENGQVLHLGVHSFTAVLHGEVRKPDLALLYDPKSLVEREVATRWADGLAAFLPDRAIRRNNPYRGAADGLTTAFRRSFPAASYVGIEIEVNQRHVGGEDAFPSWVAEALLATLPEALNGQR